MPGYILLAVAGAILLVVLFSFLRRPDQPGGFDRDEKIPEVRHGVIPTPWRALIFSILLAFFSTATFS